MCTVSKPSMKNFEFLINLLLLVSCPGVFSQCHTPVSRTRSRLPFTLMPLTPTPQTHRVSITAHHTLFTLLLPPSRTQTSLVRADCWSGLPSGASFGVVAAIALRKPNSQCGASLSAAIASPIFLPILSSLDTPSLPQTESAFVCRWLDWG